MDDYEVDLTTELGSGGFGTVYKGKKRTSGSPVAVKRSKFKDGVPRSTVREINLLKMLSDDPHFVKLLHAENDKNEELMNTVLECAETDLNIYKGKTAETIPIKEWMFQLCKGLAVSHSRGIMHRDIKPANLLLDKNKRLKIADLGLGRKVNIPTRKYTPLVGTIGYIAPEILLSAPTYTMAIDMWAAGCVFAEFASGEVLFDTFSRDIKDQLLEIFRFVGTPNGKRWSGAGFYFVPMEKKSFKSKFPQLDSNGRNLLKKMLCFDPAERITAKEAMDHPYFDDLDKNSL